MANLIVNVQHPPKVVLPLGFESEYNFRPIEFQFDAWLSKYPGGAFGVIYERPDGNTLIPIAGATESPVVWTPDYQDLAVEGIGKMQMIYTIPDTRQGLSAVFQTMVDRSLISPDSVSTEPSWAEEVINAAADIETALAYKQDKLTAGANITIDENNVISATGGGGGESAVNSVNGKTGDVELTAEDVGALPDDTVIPAAVTEQTVAGWGFTKNTGTYSKPASGIPKTDLASDVQTSLGKADTAIQQHQDISGKVDKVTGKGLSTEDYTTAEKTKLAGIQAGAQVNTVTSVNSQTGAVQIAVPTAVSQLTNDSGYQTAAQVQTAIAAIPDELPAVTASDNGKFLRVVSGTWAASTVPNAESNSFGGGS